MLSFLKAVTSNFVEVKKNKINDPFSVRRT